MEKKEKQVDLICIATENTNEYLAGMLYDLFNYNYLRQANYLVYKTKTKSFFNCFILPTNRETIIVEDPNEFLQEIGKYANPKKPKTKEMTTQAGKFYISHVDGTPIEEGAEFVVFRIDKNSKWYPVTEKIIKSNWFDIAKIDKEFALYLLNKVFP